MSKRSEKRIEYLSDHHKNFATVFASLTERYGRFKVWSDFVTMTACAISNACDMRFAKEREAMYMEAVKRYSKDEAEQISELFTETILALEDNPEQDFLGGIFGTLNLHNEWQGQFFTPYHIGVFMAKVNLSNIEDDLQKKSTVSVCDPCCGAGCLLIACANEVGKMNINYQDKILFVAQDIDFTAAMMCYIQLSLLGCQAIVKVGNSLSDPFTTNEPMSDKLWLTPMLVLKNGIANYTVPIRWYWERMIRMANQEKRLQSKVVKQWKDLYLLRGIEISYERYGEPTWVMKSNYPRFKSYQASVPITDVTKLEKNTEKFKKKYPALLKAEIEKMIDAYPDDNKFREDLRTCLRVFGGFLK